MTKLTIVSRAGPDFAMLAGVAVMIDECGQAHTARDLRAALVKLRLGRARVDDPVVAAVYEALIESREKWLDLLARMGQHGSP